MVLSLDTSCRQKRPITHLFHRNRTIYDFINAPFQNRIAIGIGETIHPGTKIKKYLFVVARSPLQKAQKTIAAQPAADSVFAHQLRT